MPRGLRRLLDLVTARAARVILGVFFREVEVIGGERVPRRGPLMIVANHVNNLIDPMLVMGFLEVRPRFLAKSTLWSHPVVAPLLVLIGAVPVYRHKDGAPVARNLETFARCREELARGGTVALFPEGRSHNEPATLPLKTGAARIALETEACHGPLGLRVIPVGLVYEEKDRFRSRVLVQVGEPIDPAAERDTYAREPRAAVRALTTRIAASLAAVTAPFGTWEEAHLVDKAVDLAAEGDGRVLRLSERSVLWRALVRRYAAMEAAEPAGAQELVAALRAYDAERRRLGLRECDLAAAPDRSVGARLRAALEWTAMAPGILLSWVPFRLTDWVAGRFTSSPDEPATYKVLAALLSFPAWWLLEAALVGRVFGPAAALAVLVAAPLSGLVVLQVRDRRRFRPRAGTAPDGEKAALAETRAALRERIRDVAGAGP